MSFWTTQPNFFQRSSLPMDEHQIYMNPGALRAIEKEILQRQPEQGGFLFGKRESFQIFHFEYDRQGRTGSVHYLPSRNAGELIARVERQTGYKLMGVIHSHPEYLDTPSGGDLDAIASLLHLNPEMPYVISPIVTHTKKQDEHEFQCDLGKISFFITHQHSSLHRIKLTLDSKFRGRPNFAQEPRQSPSSSSSPLSLNAFPFPPEVSKRISSDMKILLKFLQKNVPETELSPPEKVVSPHGVETRVYHLKFSKNFSLVCLFSSQYPFFPPFVFVKQANSQVELVVEWGWSDDDSGKLLIKAFQEFTDFRPEEGTEKLCLYYGAKGSRKKTATHGEKPFLSNYQRGEGVKTKPSLLFRSRTSSVIIIIIIIIIIIAIASIERFPLSP